MNRPVPIYKAATCHPNRPKRSTSATSLTIGAETRNEKVTPSGTPAVRKPMNKGTAEHEQNGVTTPRNAAKTCPADSRLPARIFRVLSGVKYDLMIPTPNTIRVSSSITLGTSKIKNSTVEPRCVPSRRGSRWYVIKREKGNKLL